MRLLAHYIEAIQKKEISDDLQQREVLSHLQRLADELKNSHSSWLAWTHKRRIQGLYIYGSVGVGKTYLVDLFYRHIEERKKARFHFHHFMQQIDSRLRALQGRKDPLRQIAKDIANSTRILCFDEFLVHDVAYAMILAELLQALSDNGVILVIATNTAPDDLYLNGVHRARFLPAIAILKKNCEVLCLNEQKDYRLGREPHVEAYLSPLNEHTENVMRQQFSVLEHQSTDKGHIKIQGRDIPYIKGGSRTIWFDFAVLCNLPRSQLDYLELADRFDTLFLSNIPVLTEKHTAQTIMFIYLIDVLYDRGTKLIISAAVPVQQLYVTGEMIEAFKRTQSRLLEMQSADYLNRPTRRVVKEIK